jgi:cation transport ATPase
MIENLSEHPLAQAIARKIETIIPEYLEKNLKNY